MIRMAEKRVKDAEDKVAALEAEIADLEAKLSAGDISDNSLFERHGALRKQLDNAMSEWELASMEKEQIIN